MTIEIMDTTLRDGEQTSGVSFSLAEKLAIVKLLLEEVRVNRVEITSALVSKGEYESVTKILAWASERGYIDRIEILGFVDGRRSLDWIHSAGGRVINLLAKGSLNHLEGQLRKTPSDHIADIKQVIACAQDMGIKVNLYLEDWSNGMKQSRDYVFELIDTLRQEPIERFMLPDTLGVLNPYQTLAFCTKMVERYPELRFDFHPHNDYDLAVSNGYAAVKAGVQGVHVTVNGLGERAGNAPLSSIVAVLHDQLRVDTTVVERNIYRVSKMVESYSGLSTPANQPIVGEHVFTQCAGIHADGDSKNNLYYNDLLPERFGRTREYALGKLSGKANIRKNLQALGLSFDDISMAAITKRIIELGDKKELVTQEDLPYIIADVLQEGDGYKQVRLLNYQLSLTQGLKPVANLKIEIEGAPYQASASGDGQYDAFMKALRQVYSSLNKELPTLTNYMVTIPPGGRTDALVQTVISWLWRGKNFRTRALDADQTEAAIKATVKMLNRFEAIN